MPLTFAHEMPIVEPTSATASSSAPSTKPTIKFYRTVINTSPDSPTAEAVKVYLPTNTTTPAVENTVSASSSSVPSTNKIIKFYRTVTKTSISPPSSEAIKVHAPNNNTIPPTIKFYRMATNPFISSPTSEAIKVYLPTKDTTTSAAITGRDPTPYLMPGEGRRHSKGDYAGLRNFLKVEAHRLARKSKHELSWQGWRNPCANGLLEDCFDDSGFLGETLARVRAKKPGLVDTCEGDIRDPDKYFKQRCEEAERVRLEREEEEKNRGQGDEEEEVLEEDPGWMELWRKTGCLRIPEWAFRRAEAECRREAEREPHAEMTLAHELPTPPEPTAGTRENPIVIAGDETDKRVAKRQGSWAEQVDQDSWGWGPRGTEPEKKRPKVDSASTEVAIVESADVVDTTQDDDPRNWPEWAICSPIVSNLMWTGRICIGL